MIAEAHSLKSRDADATGHSEMRVVREASSKHAPAVLAGATLYASTEPCAMCAGAISHARVARLVYGASDAKGGAVESGVRFFESPTCHWRPQVTSGVRAEPPVLESGTPLPETPIPSTGTPLPDTPLPPSRLGTPAPLAGRATPSPVAGMPLHSP